MSKVRTIHPSQPLTDVRVVILTGTLVPSLGRSLYQPLVKFFLGVRGYLTDVVCIPRLGLGDLDEANDELAEVIFAAHPNSRFILVGHSQGGLHAILLAHRFPDRVVAVFNFGAPHHGTQLARMAPWLPKHPAVRAMASHSERLRELRATNVFPPDLIYSFYTLFDQLVFPWFSPALRGANNVLVAPEIFHWFLKRIGQRRSAGVELVHGVSEHVFVIWLACLHDCIATALDGLEALALEPVA